MRGLCEAHNAKHIFQISSRRNGDPGCTTFLCLNNGEVEGFLKAAEANFEADFTLHPRPVVTIHAPFGQSPQDVEDTQKRSPFEIYQEGLQAIGAVSGLLSYAALGAVIVWVGLYTNSVSLLVAAMLIAPFAGPAMNLALAGARGDRVMIQRSLGRYIGAVVTSVVTAFLLSMLMGQEQATTEMIAAGKVSAVAVFLPLVAGAAGALNLVQSQRDSLVSGAAVGVLVAAALAPPAGNLGMSMAIGERVLALNSLYILVLQVVAINLSGGLVFYFHGVRPQQALYERGRLSVTRTSFATTSLLLVTLLFFQFQGSPSLQRSSREQSLAAEIRGQVENNHRLQLLKLEVDFLPTQKGESADKGIYIQASVLDRGNRDKQAVKQLVEKEVSRLLKLKQPGHTTFFDLTVVDA